MQALRRSSAFTLIEALVVIAIVAILLSIAAVALKGVRERGRRAKSMANLRTHVQVFGAYTNENRDFYPHFTRIGFTNTTVSGGGLEVHGVAYFAASMTWHIALADGYYGGNARSEVFAPDAYRGGPNWWPYETPYLYGCVFIAHPDYWDPTTRTGPEQYQATQADWVDHPAQKSLIVEAWPFVDDVVTAGDQLAHFLYASLCDGSARRLSFFERNSGYRRGDGPQFHMDGAVHWSDWPPLLHTLHGVRGRDVR
ncbi:MAG: type II secretion system protein [Phycisphaerales bacterium JB038]